MNEIYMLILSLIFGAALGGFFFIGLWWTVRKGLSSQNPAFLFLASQWVRTSVVVFGFYQMSGGRWQRLICGLCGFWISRLAVKTLIHLEAKRANNA